ncbi:MAG TPA: hypothetical protein ENH32_02590 [Proteobacteria bacterium]|nr:hypothetical protein [Pseudomonadota bacterium]
MRKRTEDQRQMVGLGGGDLTDSGQVQICEQKARACSAHPGKNRHTERGEENAVAASHDVADAVASQAG